MLYNVETESDPKVKLFYCTQLKELLTCLNLGAVRWMTRFLAIVSSYAELGDVQTRLGALECLSLIISICHERVKFHADIIFETLIRSLYESQVDD